MEDGSVSYDYSYKLWSERDVTAHDSGRYRWTTTTWSACNATCGTGNFIDSHRRPSVNHTAFSD